MKHKFEPCAICKSRPSEIKPEWLPGFYYTDKNKYTVAECNCHKEWKTYIRVFSRMERFSFVMTDKDYYYDALKSFRYPDEPNPPAVVLALKTIIDSVTPDSLGDFSGALVYISGKIYSGKTTLARWITKELLKKNIPTYYSTVHDFFEKNYPMGFDDNSQAIAKSSLRSIDYKSIIILDEFNSEDTNILKAYQLYFLEVFLKEQIQRKGKLIIMLSRTGPDKEKKNVSDSARQFIQNEVTKLSSHLEMTGTFSNIEIKNLFAPKDVSK